MPSPDVDILKARRDTPSCERVIHFNNAGSALPPKAVVDSVIGHLKVELELGGYEAAEVDRDKIEHFYDAAAGLIGCESDEIAFTENATRAWDMAFYSIPFKPGDRILTAMAEYASNYIAYLQVAKKTGAVIVPVPNDEHGQISVAGLRDLIDDRTRLIAITHVPTNGGLVNPAAEVGRVAKEAGVLYLLDACQSVGQMPVDVRELGCDMLSATGRKYLRGPRATGFLYVNRELARKLEPPFLDLHAATWTSSDSYEIRPDTRRFENWETNYAGKIGLGVAIDYVMSWGLDAIWRRISTLAAYLREKLAELPGVTVHDIGLVKCGIVSLSLEGLEPVKVKDALKERNIHVWYSVPESTRLDMDSRRLGPVIRASVHYYNTEEEVDRFCAALSEIR
ncbi:MAG: aminotransferase class V-fold PLP-dependent enzyme [Blastocatellia bacterium]